LRFRFERAKLFTHRWRLRDIESRPLSHQHYARATLHISTSWSPTSLTWTLSDPGIYRRTADEVQGFRYFDERDLLGFVDGTENPAGNAAADAVFIGGDAPAFAGGSYVIVQKYLHNLEAWNKLSTEAQEKIIGRSKVSDIELDDSVKPTSAHNALTTIEENGVEIKILRDNMPFGSPGRGEFGTYFIGYSRSPGPAKSNHHR
jgi:Dyp-type peroxidase family